MRIIKLFEEFCLNEEEDELTQDQFDELQDAHDEFMDKPKYKDWNTDSASGENWIRSAAHYGSDENVTSTMDPKTGEITHKDGDGQVLGSTKHKASAAGPSAAGPSAAGTPGGNIPEGNEDGDVLIQKKTSNKIRFTPEGKAKNGYQDYYITIDGKNNDWPPSATAAEWRKMQQLQTERKMTFGLYFHPRRKKGDSQEIIVSVFDGDEPIGLIRAEGAFKSVVKQLKDVLTGIGFDLGKIEGAYSGRFE